MFFLPNKNVYPSKRNSENKQVVRRRRQISPPRSTYSSKCTHLFSSQSVKQKPLPVRRSRAPLKWTINSGRPFFSFSPRPSALNQLIIITKNEERPLHLFLPHIQTKEEPLHLPHNHVHISKNKRAALKTLARALNINKSNNDNGKSIVLWMLQFGTVQWSGQHVARGSLRPAPN